MNGKPSAWLIEYAPETGMVSFATMLEQQAARVKQEWGDMVSVTPLVRGAETFQANGDCT